MACCVYVQFGLTACWRYACLDIFLYSSHTKNRRAWSQVLISHRPVAARNKGCPPHIYIRINGHCIAIIPEAREQRYKWNQSDRRERSIAPSDACIEYVIRQMIDHFQKDKSAFVQFSAANVGMVRYRGEAQGILPNFWISEQRSSLLQPIDGKMAMWLHPPNKMTPIDEDDILE